MDAEMPNVLISKTQSLEVLKNVCSFISREMAWINQ